MKAAPFNPHAVRPETFALPNHGMRPFDPSEPLPALLVKDTTPSVRAPIPQPPRVGIRAVGHEGLALLKHVRVIL